MLPYLLIVTGGIVLISLLNRKHRKNANVKCPHCEATDVIEIDRQTIESRTIEQMGAGTGAGADIRLQFDIEGSYSCRTCHKKFKRTFTETQ